MLQEETEIIKRNYFVDKIDYIYIGNDEGKQITKVPYKKRQENEG